MSEKQSRPEMARADRVLEGVWRLRLPCPWPGVPHVNAWAVADRDGLVLFDTGIGGGENPRQLEHALALIGFELADVKLLVCTHAHSDHYGAAGRVVDAAGCELWMHPAWEHIRASVEEPERTLERRVEVARQSGVPASALERYERSRRDEDPLVERLVPPDRALLPGVEVRTDLGRWQVHETPGHAPSHVVLHQPDHRLLISGDHLLGRVSLFFDYGHTPDPVAEFLGGLDTVAALDVGLCLAGHGRPFRDVGAKIEANRALVGEQLGRLRGALAGDPRTAYDVVPAVLGMERPPPAAVAWGLQLSLSYLDRLALAGEAEPLEDSDPRAWRLVARRDERDRVAT